VPFYGKQQFHAKWFDSALGRGKKEFRGGICGKEEVLQWRLMTEAPGKGAITFKVPVISDDLIVTFLLAAYLGGASH